MPAVRHIAFNSKHQCRWARGGAEIDKGKSKGRSISFLVYYQKLGASQTQTQEEFVLFTKKNICLFFFLKRLQTKNNLKFFLLAKDLPSNPKPLGNLKVWIIT